VRPPGPGTTTTVGSSSDGPDDWAGVPSERRWAMEVLGLQVGHTIERDDVQKRFRRLIRLAHPDHGGESVGAAERMAELSEARELLLSVVTDSSGLSGPAGPEDRRSSAAGSGASA
jgi:hypothetical protein